MIQIVIAEHCKKKSDKWKTKLEALAEQASIDKQLLFE